MPVWTQIVVGVAAGVLACWIGYDLAGHVRRRRRGGHGEHYHVDFPQPGALGHITCRACGAEDDLPITAVTNHREIVAVSLAWVRQHEQDHAA